MPTCLIVGLIERADGTPAPDVTVRATVRSTEEDQSGQFSAAGAVTSEPVVVFTGEDGRFGLPVAQGATMLLEIPAVNLRAVVTIPVIEGPVDLRDVI